MPNSLPVKLTEQFKVSGWREVAMKPNYSQESILAQRGCLCVAGVDEVGRGPIAGPVVAAAVVLNPFNIPKGIQDSKKLSESSRERLFLQIVESSHVAVAQLPAQMVDELNVRMASLIAMKQSIEALALKPDVALIDGRDQPPSLHCPSFALIKGDQQSLSIAAASIIAKVTRDRLMVDLDKHYPGYGMAKHKGYPTAMHREALNRLGPSEIHRRSYKPVKQALNRT